MFYNFKLKINKNIIKTNINFLKTKFLKEHINIINSIYIIKKKKKKIAVKHRYLYQQYCVKILLLHCSLRAVT